MSTTVLSNFSLQIWSSGTYFDIQTKLQTKIINKDLCFEKTLTTTLFYLPVAAGVAAVAARLAAGAWFWRSS